MFKLTSLNLNGIRSATTKGVEAWLERHAPDCICVQEMKAQHADIEGRFEVLAGMRGHFHLATAKKGYSGVGIYTRHAAILGAIFLAVAAMACYRVSGRRWYWNFGGAEFCVFWGICCVIVAMHG